MGDADYDELYKIVLVGDAGVGKTNMLACFAGMDADGNITAADNAVESFDNNRKPTIGVEFGTKIVVHDNGTRIKAQIWDTAGQERYRAITSSHYRRAAGALLVYDVNNPKSFDNAKNNWLRELRETADEDSTLLQSIMLVGNKTDKEHLVSQAQHDAAAQTLNIPMSGRTSAKTGDRINDTFRDLVCRVYDADKAKTGAKQQRGTALTGGGASSSGGGCC